MLNTPISQLRITIDRRQTSWLITKRREFAPCDHRGQIHSVVRVRDLNQALPHSNP